MNSSASCIRSWTWYFSKFCMRFVTISLIERIYIKDDANWFIAIDTRQYIVERATQKKSIGYVKLFPADRTRARGTTRCSSKIWLRYDGSVAIAGVNRTVIKCFIVETFARCACDWQVECLTSVDPGAIFECKMVTNESIISLTIVVWPNRIRCYIQFSCIIHAETKEGNSVTSSTIQWQENNNVKYMVKSNCRIREGQIFFFSNRPTALLRLLKYIIVNRFEKKPYTRDFN